MERYVNRLQARITKAVKVQKWHLVKRLHFRDKVSHVFDGFSYVSILLIANTQIFARFLFKYTTTTNMTIVVRTPNPGILVSATSFRFSSGVFV